MNSFHSRWLPFTLALLAFGTLLGCGASTTKNGGFGAADSTTAASTNQSVTQAICSQDVSHFSDFQVRLMQFVDQYGQSRSDFVRVQLKLAPAAWQTGNWNLQIYRWTAAADNSTSMDSTRLSYQIERKSASGFQFADPQTAYAYPVMDWAMIRDYAIATGINATTPQDFFNTATLLVNLRDATNSYQVLRLVLRQGGSSGTVVQETDVLIPTFAADPAVYNADSRHPITLQVLHPLKDKLGQSWSQANYYEFARGFCF